MTNGLVQHILVEDSTSMQWVKKVSSTKSANSEDLDKADAPLHPDFHCF